jgi:cytochrome c oxidase assembly factor CtaG
LFPTVNQEIKGLVIFLFLLSALLITKNMISQKRTKNEVHQLLTSYLAEHPLLTIIGKKMMTLPLVQ